MSASAVSFHLNGKQVTIPHPAPHQLLSDYLRHDEGLTGVKVACGEGGCGACVVHVSYTDPSSKETVNKTVNSCLMHVCSADGTSIMTPEGLGSKSTKVHPIQEALAHYHGSQCGFCSPGMCMSMYGYLSSTNKPCSSDAEKALDGNLCRCTGYRPILDTIQSFCGHHATVDIEDLGCTKVAPNSKRAFTTAQSTLTNSTWVRAASLSEVSSLLQKGGKIIAGGTSRGVYKEEFEKSTLLVDITLVPELREKSYTEKTITIGAAVTISEMRDYFVSISEKRPDQKEYLSAVVDHIDKIAGHPVRNAGTVGGNISVHASRPYFPSDLATIFTALNAEVQVLQNDQTKHDLHIGSLSGHFSSSLLIHIRIPLMEKNQHYVSWKVAQRHQNAHAHVNHAFVYTLDHDVITSCSISFGSVSKFTIRMKEVEAMLQGQKMSPDLGNQVLNYVELNFNPDAELGQTEYRKKLVVNLLYKSLLKLSDKIHPVAATLQSVVNPAPRPVSTSQHNYEVNGELAPVGLPTPKLEAVDQAAGTAPYVEDTSIVGSRKSYHGAYVTSTIAAGKFKSVNLEKAKKAPGDIRYIDRSDLPSSNLFGGIVKDDVIFPDDHKVQYYGQMLGVVVAKSPDQAKYAAKLVEVEYEEDPNPIVTLEQAIHAKSFFPEIPYIPYKLNRGDVDKAFQQPDLTFLEGQVEFGSQYAFYMENQASFATPIMDGRMTLHVSTQDPANVQHTVAEALDIRQNQIDTIVKRIGGGFGSKGTQSFRTAVAASVAARAVQYPVCVSLDRDTDIKTIGKRHSCLAKYKVGFNGKSGKISAIDIEFYLGAGYSYDESPLVVMVASMALDNAYFIENFRSHGNLCRMNIASSTAVRTFGSMQGIFVIESILNRVAESVKLPLAFVQKENFYQADVGQTTPLGAPIMSVDCTLDEVWEMGLSSGKYLQRQDLITKFNQENRWKKRGLSIQPLKYGHSFLIAKHGSQISIFKDGSVVIATSGIEMGQGLNTRVAQTASHFLKIPLGMISVTLTATKDNPNSGISAGSSASSASCGATQAACDILNERLKPFRASDPNISWKALCEAAAEAGVQMTATGWWTRGLVPSEKNPILPGPPSFQTPADYMSWGSCVTEVEIDTLTGETQVISANLVYDTGISHNPALDIGQVEGGYIMGLGNIFTEEVIYDDHGKLVTDSTWTYKIPSSTDIPHYMQVDLYNKKPNVRGVLRAKAASEAPMCLSVSAFFAARDAVKAANLHAANVQADSGFWTSPATVERIALGVKKTPFEW
eukprot:TRINITY_DN3944_c0_g2_i1.p1 TRINITY_DN3944_c0_g2~~TRINITY_DN3944_c0_g2_i1.p1  ORF type:complete len:1275 (-),score=347.02 TRINITY_DN3944_c0_g2_i1:75-3899(-)